MDYIKFIDKINLLNDSDTKIMKTTGLKLQLSNVETFDNCNFLFE